MSEDVKRVVTELWYEEELRRARLRAGLATAPWRTDATTSSDDSDGEEDDIGDEQIKEESEEDPLRDTSTSVTSSTHDAAGPGASAPRRGALHSTRGAPRPQRTVHVLHASSKASAAKGRSRPGGEGHHPARSTTTRSTPSRSSPTTRTTSTSTRTASSRRQAT